MLLLCTLLNAQSDLELRWERMQSRNDGIRASLDSVQAAESKKEAAASMYLPSVSLTGSYTRLSEPVKVEGDLDLSDLPLPLPGNVPYRMDLTEQDVFLADLQMLWPLYTGGKIDAAQQVYAAKADEAKAKAQMKKDALFLKLVEYYYGVVVAEALYRTHQQAEKTLKLHYNNAGKLKENGQIAEIELLNAKVKLEDAGVQRLKARHKLEIACSALAALTGTEAPPRSPLFVADADKSQSFYVDKAEHGYTALRLLDAKSKQTDALLAMEEAEWHPQVAAYGDYNLYRDDSPLMQSLPIWFAGVMVKIDLIERSDRSEKVRMAKLLGQKVHHLRLEALENLRILVEKTYKQMQASYEEYKSLDSSLALAEENERLRAVSFREGLSTSVEVVEAQTFLQGVKTRRLKAAYDFVRNVARLCVLSGEREHFFTIAQTSEEVK